MTAELDPAVIAAFGSATRVRTLAVLANAGEPLTAYRIGVVGDVPFPKVYRELARLEKARVVARRGRGWTLLDAALGDYLRRRVRMVWDKALVAEKARNAERTRRIYRLAARAHRPRAYVTNPRTEYDRPESKDRLLREMGLRTSNHARPT